MTRPVLRTKLCDILGCEYPIMLAGMGGGIAGGRLCAAVSDAGGFGMLGASRMFPNEIHAECARIRRLTNKPFGVDILVPEMSPESGSLEEIKALLPREHVEFVEQVLREENIPKVKGKGYTRTMETIRECLKAVCEEKVPWFISATGTPEWIVKECHEHGVKVISMVGSVRHALRVKERGVDLIVAQGTEAGGHTGRIGTLALIPQVVDAAYPIPVVAAGGIADGRGLAAALALGAIGVWVGTRFLLSDEVFVDGIEKGEYSKEHVEYYQRKLIEARDQDPIITRVFTGKTLRALPNKFSDLWEVAGLVPLDMTRQIVLVDDFLESCRRAKRFDLTNALSGNIAGMLKEKKPAKQIVEEMVEGAINILKNNLPRYMEMG